MKSEFINCQTFHMFEFRNKKLWLFLKFNEFQVTFKIDDDNKTKNTACRSFFSSLRHFENLDVIETIFFPVKHLFDVNT